MIVGNKQFMEMQMTRCILIIVLIFFSACKERYNEVVVQRWEDGSEKIIHTFDNQIDTTSYVRTFYYQNGNLGTKGRINNGQKDGIWEWWYSNGNKKDLANFNLGLYVNERKHWREDGSLKLIEVIDNSCDESIECCDGKLLFYNEQSIKVMEYNMKDCEYDGVGYSYFSDGKIKREFNYRKGKKEGVNYEYYPNGNLRVSGEYQNDLEQGKWVYVDSLGKEEAYEFYENGKVVKTELVN
ncbi:hypothetical protein V6R21_02940 [Limibacter armeniacum]|uniref:toxin-antitoxin system YwqK family antitoxin n=1 Tax=Limibacter armeniacum TaxID=466084 RepID=UPI002FE60D75